MTESAFHSLWTPLLQYAAARGIDRDSAKDLAMETIERVIDRFDPDRGDMLHFAYRILGNKIKNFFRDNAHTGAMPGDVADDAPTAHDRAVMREEEQRAAAMLELLRTQINPLEVRLLSILQLQIQQGELCNVSAAARTAGIDPLKAHDLLRKMQRRLIRIQNGPIFAEKQAPYAEKLSSIEMPADVCASMEAPGVEEFDLLLTHTKDIDVFQKISLYVKNIRR